jgi:hypothetical protein
MIKFFNNDSTVVGKSKIETISHLLKQVKRQLPESIEDTNIPHLGIKMNQVQQQVVICEKAIQEVLKYITDQQKHV